MGLIVPMLLADLRPKFGITQNHEPPVLNIEAGRRLDRRFELLLFLGGGHFVIGVEMLDRAASVDRFFDFHTDFLVRIVS